MSKRVGDERFNVSWHPPPPSHDDFENEAKAIQEVNKNLLLGWEAATCKSAILVDPITALLSLFYGTLLISSPLSLWLEQDPVRLVPEACEDLAGRSWRLQGDGRGQQPELHVRCWG
jgi:hypothetical protein